MRKIRPIADNPRKILSAFAEDGWPDRIDSPLDPEADLTRAVRTLNDGLKSLKSTRDGSGEGIVWKHT